MAKKNNPNLKLFVVRKYVWAVSARDAIKAERKHTADEVWVDEDFKKKMADRPDAIGFQVSHNDDE